MYYVLDKWDEKRLSPNLGHHELHCKCSYNDCTFTQIHSTIIESFENLRMASGGKPLLTTSAYRCQRHNLDVGGVPNSFHKRGLALDIAVPDHVELEEFVKMASGSGFTYILAYPDEGFIHCQISPKKLFDHFS